MRALLLATALVLAIGCGGEDDRPASWHYIHAAIIKPSCTTIACHSNDNAQAGVRLHDPEAAYAILVGAACNGSEDPPGSYVLPGDPDRSRLVHLIRGEVVERPMPPDRLLPQVDVDLIERWILEGAPCN